MARYSHCWSAAAFAVTISNAIKLMCMAPSQQSVLPVHILRPFAPMCQPGKFCTYLVACVRAAQSMKSMRFARSYTVSLLQPRHCPSILISSAPAVLIHTLVPYTYSTLQMPVAGIGGMLQV
jgi:hypothetical protein